MATQTPSPLCGYLLRTTKNYPPRSHSSNMDVYTHAAPVDSAKPQHDHRRPPSSTVHTDLTLPVRPHLHLSPQILQRPPYHCIYCLSAMISLHIEHTHLSTQRMESMFSWKRRFWPFRSCSLKTLISGMTSTLAQLYPTSLRMSSASKKTWFANISIIETLIYVISSTNHFKTKESLRLSITR